MQEICIKKSLKITPMQIGGNSTKVHLILNGNLDTYTSPDFQSHINSLIHSGTVYLIFNCSGLSYISSTGIGAFTAFLKHLKQKNGDMVLYGITGRVMEIFQILGFAKFFKVASNLDEALRLLKGESIKSEQYQSSARQSVFPLIVHCPHCTKRLKTVRPGRFMCSGCDTTFSVDEKGNIGTD